MISEDELAVLVLNGEIYNFRELRTELVAKGYRFRGQSDTDVLLQLYLAEREAMLERLNGIFALALWDKRDRTLLLARDALGVKPLYYAEPLGRWVELPGTVNPAAHTITVSGLDVSAFAQGMTRLALMG